MTLLTDREIDAEQLRAEEALEDFEVQPSQKVKLEHELNGEHDNATIQCLELGDSQDRWQVKRTDSEASGVLTIYHDGENPKNQDGWNWDGCPSLVETDGSCADALQEIMDCVAGEYE